MIDSRNTVIANTKANAKEEMGEADLTEKLAKFGHPSSSFTRSTYRCPPKNLSLPAQKNLSLPAQKNYSGPPKKTYPCPAKKTYPSPANKTYPCQAKKIYPNPAKNTYPVKNLSLRGQDLT